MFIVYHCKTVHCNLSNYQRDEDYGIYPGVYASFPDCQDCKDKCSNDPNCGGVECKNPDDYCRWWKQGKCVTKDEQEKNPAYETCIKKQKSKNIFSSNYPVLTLFKIFSDNLILIFD